MWFIQPKRDYVAEMPWKHADEPAVMTWQVRARDYNTFIANLYFVFIFMVSFAVAGGLFLAMFSYNESIFYSFFLGGGTGFFVLLIGMSISHQTAIIVYRLTDKRIEVFSWKPQIDSVKPVMKWTAIISGVGVLCLVFINPDFIIAAIGPVGIGVMAALMGNSKGYQSMARNQMEDDVAWRDAQNIYAYSKRSIIGLNLYWQHPETGKEMKNFVKAIFIPKEKYDEVLSYLQKEIPDVPVIEGKFDVYHV
ncbi:hypothetical protein HXW73_07225 [Halomonas sp. SH5A2]|uniref:hypothetical protein n=1 Tax=Halomonas sp. SH5A2 TaxID=2749040 RepID=UPI0016409A5D|nr:hypothetical protein [Halomonas sp. SH5A2]QNI02744.1 hypothetical protein HXW73_07225 [Halomonas sp. SH5A2]